MSDKSQKKIDVFKFITEIYNPDLNEFMIPISDEIWMGYIIYEGRTIYRKNFKNLTARAFSTPEPTSEQLIVF